MTGPAQLIHSGDGVLQLQGTITFHSVVPLYQECQRLLVPGIRRLDCRGIRQSDSSAISLLLACRRLANSRALNLSIDGMGEQLLSLARLYGVETLLTE